MKVHDFARAVARATGESVSFIQAMGFSPLDPPTKLHRTKSKKVRRWLNRQLNKPTPAIS